MADELNVTPSDLSAAGDQLSDVSSQVKSVLSSLQAKLAGYGEPWGDDSTGKSFANGSEGYIAQRDWVFGAISNNTSVLDGYASSLSDSAQNFDQLDNS